MYAIHGHSVTSQRGLRNPLKTRQQTVAFSLPWSWDCHGAGGTAPLQSLQQHLRLCTWGQRKQGAVVIHLFVHMFA